MSVRVVARIRPLLDKEEDKDIIVRADSSGEGRRQPNVVKIPNPKNEAEEFSFTFNSVYDQSTTQEALFNAEVAPHIKALFQGVDVTIFAYGVTGTGKTHTMRGGLKLAERGVIPRLLSNVFRRGKKIVKDSDGETSVDVALSYYEIYNDKVFDLLEPPEKRTPSGLPLREKDGKTFVVGLSERSCGDLKDFERLYIEANHNRVTASTKLNAHSSRSHAILRVKVTQITGDRVLESTASAIDLAGSEDNRRTDNGKERLVESAAINKSLFVLSQCVDAISRGEKRIPYRESKMTRILSLGQNNGITVMILNLAPLRSYHLDTLSSLNVSSRAKRIEVREIENEVVFKQPPRTNSSLVGSNIAARQPLRPLANAHNVHTGVLAAKATAAAENNANNKPVKAFSVYADRSKASAASASSAAATAVTRPAQQLANTSQPRRSNSNKRPSDSSSSDLRPSKLVRPSHSALARGAAASQQQPAMSAAEIEAIIERKVAEALAARAQSEAQQLRLPSPEPQPLPAQQQNEISDAVQKRLEALERRIEETRSASAGTGDDARSDGLRFLLIARQHKEMGDDEAALRHYEMALPYFPGQVKLLGKIEKLRAKLGLSRDANGATLPPPPAGESAAQQHGEGEQPKKRKSSPRKKSKGSSRARRHHHEEISGGDDDTDYRGGEADVDDDDDEESSAEKKQPRPAKASRKPKAVKVVAKAVRELSEAEGHSDGAYHEPLTPRKQQLLDIVNSRDVLRIRGLAGLGAKKARDLVEHLEMMAAADADADADGFGGSRCGTGRIETLAQLRGVPGMGGRTVDRAYEGLIAASSV